MVYLEHAQVAHMIFYLDPAWQSKKRGRWYMYTSGIALVSSLREVWNILS